MSQEFGIREEEYASKLDFSLWRRLWVYIRPYKAWVIQLCITNSLLAIGETAIPLLTKYAIDTLLYGGTKGQVWLYFAAVVGLALSLCGCLFIFMRRAGRIENYVSYDIRKACFDHLQDLSFSYYDKTPVGFIMARMTSDTLRLAETIAWSLVDILWASLRIISALVAMLWLNFSITMWVILVIPPLALVTRYFHSRIFRIQRRVRRTNSRITHAYNESIMGAVTTKSLVREDQNLNEFSQITDAMFKDSFLAAKYNAVFRPIIVTLGAIGTALALWRGGLMVLDGVIWFGTISAFATYSMQFFEPMHDLSHIFTEMHMAQASAERLFTLLDTEPSVRDTEESIVRDGDTFSHKKENWVPIRGEVQFEHVNFSYLADQPVLKDFNLSVKAGQTIALVGQTGSGKSTIVNLLCRFYEPTSGRILIDGEDYRNHSQLWLQSNLGYVLQSPHLFSGTIADNIRYADPSATDEQVEAAARLVSAHDFISKLENGYQTQVGEGGNRLSTGQKQLISFARAVLHDPPLFILDEATSSIDTETEQLIQQAINATLKNRTNFIVAHRLSTIRSADLILVLQHGEVVEQGTHEELLALKGYYYTLHNHQLLQEQQEALINGR
ncbi:MAG: ABC transporter ATP-binding protein [Clostridia bacterium]|nr:ABC transporter ATP-binding protein [Clostridia bacterium]